jgi:DNA-binding CsgD family transcriptional regulator
MLVSVFEPYTPSSRIRSPIVRKPGPFETGDTGSYQVLSVDALRAQYGITGREAQIARYVALGQTNAEIAKRLRISVFTVRRHVEHVFSRLGVKRRSEVAIRLLARTEDE